MGKLRKIVLVRSRSGPQFTDAQFQQLETRFPDITFVTAAPEDLRSALHDADAVMAWQLSPEDLAAAPQLQWVQTVGAGMDRFLTPELVRRGIPITNNSGVHAPNIAEHILALMLAFARRLPELIRDQERHEWLTGPLDVFELSGQTLLVVGAGDIGQALGQRAAALGLRVDGIRRHPDQPLPAGFTAVEGLDQLPDLLPGADHVALCVPLTQRTNHLFDGAMLGRMKRGSFIYNIGRGSLIDTEALIAALRSGQIGGAGLDVTDPEPLPPDSPLWEMPNVIITDHTSGRTPHYWDRALPILTDNIDRFQHGQPLRNLVDVKEGY